VDTLSYNVWYSVNSANSNRVVPTVGLSKTAPVYPFTSIVAIWVHPVPDRVKPSFVIFDIRALWRSALSVRVPGYCQKLQMAAA